MCPPNTAIECFVADKETLFRAFQLTSSVKFEDFVRCWSEAKFSLVLYGRRMRDLRDWLPACYSAILPDLRRLLPINRRIFALFLLYGMYFKHPLQQSIPIRVALDGAWKDLDELRHYAVRENLLDVLFVWHKLLSSGGIQIVQSLVFYGPLTAKTSQKDMTVSVSDKKHATLQAELDPQLADLMQLNAQYENMKMRISSSESGIKDLVADADTLSEFRIRLQSGNLISNADAHTMAAIPCD